MKLYYVENKCFFISRDGMEYQCADGGQLPMLYTDCGKAIMKAQRLERYYGEINGAKVIIPDSEYRSKGSDLKYACRMMSQDGRYRYEIRVYEVETR